MKYNGVPKRKKHWEISLLIMLFYAQMMNPSNLIKEREWCGNNNSRASPKFPINSCKKIFFVLSYRPIPFLPPKPRQATSVLTHSEEEHQNKQNNSILTTGSHCLFVGVIKKR